MSEQRMTSSEEFLARNRVELVAQLPTVLGECRGTLCHNWVERNRRRVPPEQTLVEPSEAELARRMSFVKLARAIDARKRNGEAVAKLLNDVWSRRAPFVLYLRSFSLGARAGLLPVRQGILGRRDPGAHFKMTSEEMDDRELRVELKRAVAPVQILEIRNAEESDYTVLSFESTEDGWQDAAKALIGAASSIVVFCGERSPGVDLELSLIRSADRVRDTLVFLNQAAKPDGALQEFRCVRFSKRISDEDATALNLRDARANRRRALSTSPPKPKSRMLDDELLAVCEQDGVAAYKAAHEHLNALQFYAARDAFLYAAGNAAISERSDTLAVISIHVSTVYQWLRNFQLAAEYARDAADLAEADAAVLRRDATTLWGVYAAIAGDATSARGALQELKSLPPLVSPDGRFLQHLLECFCIPQVERRTSAAWQRAKQCYAEHRGLERLPLLPDAWQVRAVRRQLAGKPGWLQRRKLRRSLVEWCTAPEASPLARELLRHFDGEVTREHLLACAATPDEEFEIERS